MLATKTALANPAMYLGKATDGQNERAVTWSSPDISILFMLGRECGRMINLYDWLTAFTSILEKDPAQRSTEEIQ